MLERCSRKTGPVDRFRLPTNLGGFLGEAVLNRVWKARLDSEGEGGCRREGRGGATKLEDKGTKSMGMLLIPSPSAAVGGLD